MGPETKVDPKLAQNELICIYVSGPRKTCCSEEFIGQNSTVYRPFVKLHLLTYYPSVGEREI